MNNKELLVELKCLRLLCSLLTVRQVIEAGDKYIEAAGLNPWAMNEGLATGNEPLGLWRLDALISIIEAA